MGFPFLMVNCHHHLIGKADRCAFIMPELPEVETVRRGLAPVMEGGVIKKVVLNRPNLRFPFPDSFAARLEGQKILSVGRRAKYLVLDLQSGDALVMHLGMSGSFRIELAEGVSAPGVFHHPRSDAQKHDHVIITAEGPHGYADIIYNDPRRFGFMDLVARSEMETHKHFVNVGVEPTGNSLDGALISRLFSGKSSPLKATLLDQRLIAGLGNIYVCEALWQARLSPTRKSTSITRKDGKATQRTELLASSIREIIANAIEAGGSSLRDHKQTDGTMGYFQHSFNVYDREGELCKNEECNASIKRIVQSGRSTFYCPSCQR